MSRRDRKLRQTKMKSSFDDLTRTGQLTMYSPTGRTIVQLKDSSEIPEDVAERQLRFYRASVKVDLDKVEGRTLAALYDEKKRVDYEAMYGIGPGEGMWPSTKEAYEAMRSFGLSEAVPSESVYDRVLERIPPKKRAPVHTIIADTLDMELFNAPENLERWANQCRKVTETTEECESG